MSDSRQEVLRELRAAFRNMDPRQGMTGIERLILPALADTCAVELVALMVHGRGPLELATFGGSHSWREDFESFLRSDWGEAWVTRLLDNHGLQSDRAGLADPELAESPLRASSRGEGLRLMRALSFGVGETGAILLLARSTRLRPFSNADEDAIESLAPSLTELCQSLARRSLNPEDAFLDALDEGVCFFDHSQRLLSANLAGWSHLRLISQGQRGPRPLPPELTRCLRLAQDLRAAGRASGNEPIEQNLVSIHGTGFRLRAIKLTDRPGVILCSRAQTLRTLPSDTELVQRYGLTKREAEVCLLMARGERNQRIARRLGITEHTIKLHARKVLTKLGISSRSAVVHAITVGPERASS